VLLLLVPSSSRKLLLIPTSAFMLNSNNSRIMKWEENSLIPSPSNLRTRAPSVTLLRCFKNLEKTSSSNNPKLTKNMLLMKLNVKLKSTDTTEESTSPVTKSPTQPMKSILWPPLRTSSKLKFKTRTSNSKSSTPKKNNLEKRELKTMLISKADKSKPPRLLMPSTLLFPSFPLSNLKLMLKLSLLNSTELVVITPSLPLFHLPQPSHLKSLKLLTEKSLNLEHPLFNPLKTIKKLKLKPKLTSETSLKNSPHKEKPCNLKF